MAQVLFSFKLDVPDDRREQILADLRRAAAVTSAAPLKPDARQPSLRRHCYAVVDDDAASGLVDDLRGRQEIDSADLPPRRGVAAG
jgi:hypothetical protein